MLHKLISIAAFQLVKAERASGKQPCVSLKLIRTKFQSGQS